MQDMSSPRSEGIQNPYGLFRVKGKRRIDALILSKTWVGVLSHYASKQSVICEGASCEICIAKRTNPRWRGYVMAQIVTPERPIVTLEFTERCFQAFRDRLDAYGSLAGHTVRLMRTKDQSNAPLHAMFQEMVVPSQRLTCSVDVCEQVARFYRCKPELIRFGLPQSKGDIEAEKTLAEARNALRLKKA